MTFSPEHLESLTTKEDVIEYAASFDIVDLNKKRKLETLKQNVLEALKQRTSPPVSLFAALEAETAKGVQEELAPVAGGENVTIKLKGVVVTTIPVPALESWCIANDVDYRAVKDLVGLYHLHHNHYTFHKS